MTQQEPHAAALGVHGSEPEVPSRTRHQPQLTGDDIATLRPWEPGSKLDLRRCLNRIALLANARAQRASSPDARELFWGVTLLAGQWTFDSAPEAVLADIRDALVRMVLAAAALERCGSGL